MLGVSDQQLQGVREKIDDRFERFGGAARTSWEVQD